MKKVLAVCIVATLLSCMLGLTAMATSADIQVEVVDNVNSVTVVDPEVSEKYYESSDAGGFEVPGWLRKILNGPDQAGPMFGLDKFKPQKADTRWADPFVVMIGKFAAYGCSIFFIWTFFNLLVDMFCIAFYPLGKFLEARGLRWYSDAGALVLGLKIGSGEGIVQTVPENMKVDTKLQKLAAWLKESLITGVLIGIVFTLMGTGLLPVFFTMLVNIGVNGVSALMTWMRGL